MMYNERLDQFFVNPERPEPGITPSSASFLAGLASQEVNRLEAVLKGTKFYDTAIELLSGGAEPRLVGKGKDKAFLEQLLPTLTKIGELHGFIAYVHEAVKERDRRDGEIKSCSFQEWLDLPDNKSKKDEFDKYLELRKPSSPIAEKEVGIDWVKTRLSVKELAHFLLLEAKASTLGINIHPDGLLSTAKDDLSAKISMSVEPIGEGRETTIRTYKPSIDPGLVYTNYNQLQQKHRLYEAELNAMKAKLDVLAKNENLERNRVYREKLVEYQKALSEYQVELEKRKGYQKQLETEYADWLLEETDRVRKLKIVVPHEFQAIFDYLASLGQ